MKTHPVLFTALLSGLVVPASADEPDDPWHHSYAAAHAAASERGLPLLLHFYADWCGPCRRMEQSVLNSGPVREHMGTSVIGAKINVEREPDVAQRFGVTGYPTDVLLSPEGTVLATNSGFASSDEYVALMTSQIGEDRATEAVAVWEDPAATPANIGLRGFSPVSITRDRAWQKGDSRFAWSHHGVVYHLVDAEELTIFQADPDRFVPRLSGYDPLLLATENRRVAGDIEHGVFYRDGLYLHATRENRKRFLATPEKYATKAAAVLTPDPDKLTLAGPKP